jgi:hypothetical protein
VDVEFVNRLDGRPGLRLTAAFLPDDDGAAHSPTDAGTASRPDSWSAEVPVGLAALGDGTWDLRLCVRFHDGTSRETTAHAVAGPGLLRRTAVPSARRGVLLVQPYATHAGSLAVRLAPGWRGMTAVARRRLKRLLR